VVIGWPNIAIEEAPLAVLGDGRSRFTRSHGQLLIALAVSLARLEQRRATPPG
jgi:hypothetical protein